jgi:hypothetical protein
MPDEEPTISYGLKDVLARLEHKLDQVFAALTLKADRAEVTQLDHRVGQAEGRLTALEQERETAERHYRERVDHRRWLIPTLAALLSALATLAAAFAAFHH